MGNSNQKNHASHDNIDYLRRCLYDTQLGASVLHGAVEQSREDTADRIGATDQCHGDSLESETFLSGKLAQTASHTEHLNSSAKSGEKS